MKKEYVQHFWELLWGMTEKELHARYKHTVFGFLWLVANPLLQMIVIGFIFTFLWKEPVEHYFYYLFTGLLVWSFFSTSLTKATPSLVYENALIKKSVFPRSIIPISIIFSNFLHFVTAFLLFLIPVIALGKLTAISLPYVIVALIFLLIFTIGLSLLTCALNVRYRDINFFVQALLIIWFYATPIVYSFSQLPKELLWVWRLNPLTSILQLMQHALIGAAAPGPAMLASNTAVIIVTTALGILVFRDESKNFDDWL